MTVLGVLGGYYLDRNATNSVKLTATNFNTLKYTQNMTAAVNDVSSILSVKDLKPEKRRGMLRTAFGKFERQLNLQESNITEIGEDELMGQMRVEMGDLKEQAFRALNDTTNNFVATNYIAIFNIQEILKTVYTLNDRAISIKNQEAYETAAQVTLYMIILGFIFFIFAVISMFYFPDYIADKINNLTRSIRQISEKNYSQRLDIDSKDEFGEMAASFNIMAEKLEEYDNMNVAKIVSEKRRIETIIGKMKAAIIGLDNEQKVLFVNPKALQMLGLDETKLIGKTLQEIGAEEEIMAGFANDFKEEIYENRSYPAVTVNDGGKTFYYEKEILVVSSNDEHIAQANVGYVLVLKNITEFKEQDLAKTHFMATLSHELKTPIAAIDMSLQLLKDERIGELNEDQDDLTNTIKQNTSRLIKMVNEILDISRIETGNVNIQKEQVQPQEIVEKAVSSTKSLFSQKGVALKESYAPNLAALNVDVQKTSGVLINFLSNALRYSKRGDVIQINVLQKNGHVEFSVKDQGPGIKMLDQATIFDKFKRVKDDNTKGTGLGLAISKEFIEQQGGEIWLDSDFGEGATFYFSLPV